MTLSKKLPHAARIFEDEPASEEIIHWEHIVSVSSYMSWGVATVNLHRKVTAPVE